MITNLSILLTCLQCYSVTAWIQPHRSSILRVRTSTRQYAEDDKNLPMMGVDNVFLNSSIRNYQNNDAVHIGGLFESLSPLPVYEWADQDFDSDWMNFGNICRGEECEVSLFNFHNIFIEKENYRRTSNLSLLTVKLFLYFTFSNAKFPITLRIPPLISMCLDFLGFSVQSRLKWIKGSLDSHVPLALRSSSRITSLSPFLYKPCLKRRRNS